VNRFCTTFEKVCCARPSGSANGVAAVRHWQRRTPSDHRSEEGPYPSERTTSGAMNSGVPHSEKRGRFSAAPVVARPKSAMTGQPSRERSTFSGLRSRYTMPIEWSFCSASTRQPT